MHAHCVHDRPLGIFPIEVYEPIIDAVHWHSNDAGGDRFRVMRGVLCRCALTCQAWLPRSRVLLYRSITLYSSPGRTCDRRVVRRLANTIHASSFIADLVNHLTISEASASKSGIASVLPFLLVDSLPKLHTLIIQETTLVVGAAFCHSMGSFPALTTLNLATVMFANVCALRRLLAALPKLRDLQLDNVFWQTVGVAHETAGRYIGQMPRVQRLSMIGGQVCTFYGTSVKLRDFYLTAPLYRHRLRLWVLPRGPYLSSSRRTSNSWCSRTGTDWSCSVSPHPCCNMLAIYQ